MSDYNYEEEQVAEPVAVDPFAAFAEQQAKFNQTLTERIEQIGQMVQPRQAQEEEVGGWVDPEVAALKREVEELRGGRASDTKDKVIEMLKSNPALSEDERDEAVKRASSFQAKDYVGQDARNVARTLAAHAKLEIAETKPREQSAANTSSQGNTKDRIDPGFANWLRNEAKSDVTNEQLVAGGYHLDDDLYEQYTKTKGRR